MKPQKAVRVSGIVMLLVAMVLGLSGNPFFVASLFAAAPVFTNNGTTETTSVSPGNTNQLGLDITLPAPDADTFLDGDGTTSTAAGAQEVVVAGNVLPKLVLPGGQALCGNTDGTSVPSNIVHDADGLCGSTESNVSRVDSTDNVGQWTSMVLDGSGYPVVSYYDATNQKLKVLHCNDVNCAGGDESITTPDSSTDNIGQATFLRLDGSGNPMILYYDATAIEHLKFMHCNDPNCAGGNESITLPTDQRSWPVALMVDAGNPVIVYENLQSGYLGVIGCNDADCAGDDETIAAVEDSSNRGAYADAVLDASGFPVVGFYSATFPPNSPEITHCVAAACAGTGDVVSNPTSGWYGYGISLAIDATGYPVASYGRGNGGGLELMHCNDANCTGGGESFETIDAGVSITDTSMLLVGGNPVVAYYDITNGVLKLLACNDPNCAGGNDAVNIVDLEGNVGNYLSLAFDGTNNPVLAYYDATNQDLKVTHCNDANCAGGARTVVLGADSSAWYNLSATASLIAFRDTSANGTWASGEDLYFDEDDSGFYNADYLDAVTAQQASGATAQEGSDLDFVKLWTDNGDGIFNSTTDTNITYPGPSCAMGVAPNSWECDVNNLLLLSALRIFVTYDVVTSATAGRTVRFEIPVFSDSGTAGAFTVGDAGIFFSNAGAANTGNHDGPAAAITNAITRTIAVAGSSNISSTSGGGGTSTSSEPVANNSQTETISSSEGGSVTETAANDGSTATVEAEAGALPSDGALTIQTFAASDIYAQNPLPEALTPGGKAVFDITATIGGTPVTAFTEQPLTLTFTYRENQLAAGVSEGDLRLATFDSGEGNWYVLEDAVVDTATNTVTYQASHLTRFALVSAADTVPPQPPSQLSAASIATGGVRLRWQNPSQDFHHVRISRSVDGSSTKELLATQVRTASYDDTTAQNGRTYSYFVASVDPAGNISSESRASIVPGTVVSAEPQQVATPADANDGDLVRASNTIEVYVTKKVGATVVIRHIVNSRVFYVYGHFGGVQAWSKIVGVDSLGEARRSAWVRGSDGKVWEVNGDGSRHHMRMTWGEFALRVAGGESDTGNNVVFEVNDAELSLYAVGADVMP